MEGGKEARSGLLVGSLMVMRKKRAEVLMGSLGVAAVGCREMNKKRKMKREGVGITMGRKAQRNEGRT